MEIKFVSYRPELESKIDVLFARLPMLRKKKLFGGICYLTCQGQMCFGVWGESVILRLGPQKAETAFSLEGFSPFDITGRPMKGWVMVRIDNMSDPDLLSWLDASYAFAMSLPQR